LTTYIQAGIIEGMRQTYSISLGSEDKASTRWARLDELASENGTDRSGLIQRIADGDIQLVTVPGAKDAILLLDGWIEALGKWRYDALAARGQLIEKFGNPYRPQAPEE
jgi:hypothetical protein